MQPPDFDPTKDYYKTLGVPPSSTEKDIKAAYYKLAQQYHPDKNQGKTSEKFKDISAAYNVLGNKDKKQQYDTARTYSRQDGPQQGNPFGGSGGFRSPFGENPFGRGFGQQTQYERNRQDQQQQTGSQQKGGRYTYYRTSDGDRGKDFINDFFKKQQEMFRQQQMEQERIRREQGFGQFKERDFNSNRSQYEQYNSNFKHPSEEERKREEDQFKESWEQWQRQGPGFNDPLYPMMFLQTFIKMLLIFFGTLFVFRMLFGRRKQEIDPMDEYMYYQMQNDPALQHRLAVAQNVGGAQYVRVPYPHPQSSNLPPVGQPYPTPLQQQQQQQMRPQFDPFLERRG